MGSLDALGGLWRVAQGERPTEYELVHWYRRVVIAECASRPEAALILGVDLSTIAREKRGIKAKRSEWSVEDIH